ncbi:protein N-lysine methyltransferase METTL21A-like [Styela clava]
MINFCNVYLVLLLAFLTESMMAGENGQALENHSTGGCEDKNWALVPYELTHIQLFPSFKEKTRKFNFKGIEDEITIYQDWDEKGVAAVVWEAAIELSNYIIKSEEMKGKTVLELGAGTGLVGIVCSKLGAKVTVTDLKEALPFLSKNIDKNFQNDDKMAPKVQELKWGDNLNLNNPKDYDIIIGADVIYIEDTFGDLLDTICYLSGVKGYESSLYSNGNIAQNKKPTTLLSAKMRYTREAKFINKLKKFFNVEKVFSNSDTNIDIYKALPS